VQGFKNLPLAMLRGRHRQRLLVHARRSLDVQQVLRDWLGRSRRILAWEKELKPDMDRVNVNGGAIALGHPIGATGVRIAVTLLHEMARRRVRRGLATLCVSGGMGLAAAFEAV